MTPATRLREDLAFAAPELWMLHIERRMAEAVEEERERLLARARQTQEHLAASWEKDAAIAWIFEMGPFRPQLMEVSVVHTDAAPGEMDDHGAWGFTHRPKP